MRRKAWIAMAAALSLCASMAGCGNKGNTDSDIEAILNSMNENDLEQAFESLEQSKADTSAAESETEASPEIVYEPCDEIKNAGLDSWYIQIGSEVFKNGGYYTIDQFAAEFGDKYDMTEMNPDKQVWTADKDGESNCKCIYDPTITIHVNYNYKKSNEDTVRLGDGIVTRVSVNGRETTDAGKKSFEPPFINGIDGDPTEMDYNSICKYYEDAGLLKNTPVEASLHYGVYWKEQSGKDPALWACVQGSELNLYGCYPIYLYSIGIKKDTLKAYGQLRHQNFWVDYKEGYYKPGEKSAEE